MAKALHIELWCEGNPITALSDAKDISKVYGDVVYVNFYEGFKIGVYPDSYPSDLVTIYSLKRELKQLKESNGKKEEK